MVETAQTVMPPTLFAKYQQYDNQCPSSLKGLSVCAYSLQNVLIKQLLKISLNKLVCKQDWIIPRLIIVFIVIAVSRSWELFEVICKVITSECDKQLW